MSHPTYEPSSPQGMSDDTMNMCMRSFDMAMVKESYLGDIKRQIVAREAEFDDNPDSFEWNCRNVYCPCNINRLINPSDRCSCGEENCPCKVVHIMSPGDEDCHCDRIHITPTAPFDLSFLDERYTDSYDTLYEFKPDIRAPKRRKENKTAYKPHNWRAEYSSNELLEHDLESFDFILSRLLAQDSPYYPNRTFSLREPGCPACDSRQSHPLPKYQQFNHDFQDLYDLINARQWEWKYLTDELEGHDDWFFAWDAVSEFMKLGTKLSGLKIPLHRLQREESKGNMGVEELNGMMKEAMVELGDGSWRPLRAFREQWEDPEESEEMDW
ncbi:MAG: hypothetical protein LQ337_005654 [Flavoplaca oasis]|nr:MAG: hypothetical protein LQ337_005654 [Flavoplaca oasis]